MQPRVTSYGAHHLGERFADLLHDGSEESDGRGANCLNPYAEIFAAEPSTRRRPPVPQPEPSAPATPSPRRTPVPETRVPTPPPAVDNAFAHLLRDFQASLDAVHQDMVEARRQNQLQNESRHHMSRAAQAVHRVEHPPYAPESPSATPNAPSRHEDHSRWPPAEYAPALPPVATAGLHAVVATRTPYPPRDNLSSAR